MFWVILILIVIVVVVIGSNRKKQPAQRSFPQATIPTMPGRAESGRSKITESLCLGYLEKVRLTIRYETGNPLPGEPAIKVRDVDIYGIGSEYFDAYCHYRCTHRTFKISRVSWVQPSGIRYQIPASYVPSGWVTDGWGEYRTSDNS